MIAQRDAVTEHSAERPAGSETRNVKLEKKELLVEQVSLLENSLCTWLIGALPVSLL